jgi:hypothetical protein
MCADAALLEQIQNQINIYFGTHRAPKIKNTHLE